MMRRRRLAILALIAVGAFGCALQLPSVPVGAAADAPSATARAAATSENQVHVSTLALDTGNDPSDWVNNLAVDDQDNLCLVTRSGIDKVAPDGKRTHLLDSTYIDAFLDDNPDKVSEAEAVAVAHDGTIYVWGGAGRLYHIAPSGKLTSVLVGKHYGTPPSLALDARGNVYVSVNPGLGLPGDHEIVKVTPEDDVRVYAGRKGGGAGYADGPANQALFNQPGALAFDGKGNLYVADQGNQVIRRITPDGTVSTVVARLDGDTWGVPDGVGGARWGPPPLGSIIHTAPGFSPPPSPSPRPVIVGSFSLLGLTVDRAGNLYFVADDNRIRRLTPDGTLSVFAGDGRKCPGPQVCEDDTTPCQSPDPTACERDGPALEAEFAAPTAIVADSHGTLYVLDAGNGWSNTRVRVIR